MEKGIGMSTDAQKEMFVCMHEINKKSHSEKLWIEEISEFPLFFIILKLCVIYLDGLP